MASRNAQLADAVVAALNTAAQADTFVLNNFTAVRRPAPVNDLAELSTLTVSVIPSNDESERIARDISDHELTVFIGIEQRIGCIDPSSATAPASFDPLMELVENIDDWLGTNTVPATNGLGLFIDSTIRQLSDIGSLRTQNLFRGVVQAKFKLPVAAT